MIVFPLNQLIFKLQQQLARTGQCNQIFNDWPPALDSGLMPLQFIKFQSIVFKLIIKN